MHLNTYNYTIRVEELSTCMVLSRCIDVWKGLHQSTNSVHMYPGTIVCSSHNHFVPKLNTASPAAKKTKTIYIFIIYDL